jgi:hypothetical protein
LKEEGTSISIKTKDTPICKTRQVEDENRFILKCRRFEQFFQQHWESEYFFRKKT